MLRRFLGVSVWLGLWWIGVVNAWGEPVPASETLLPNTTAGWVSITNVDTLSEQWNKTQLGQLMADKVMEPFTEDIRRQFQDRWSGVHERLGLTLDDLNGVPGGEAALAIIRPAPAQSATVLVIDVTGHQAQAKAMIAKASANLQKQQAKKTERNICDVPAIVFELPPPKRETTAVRAGDAATQARPETVAAPAAQVRYTIYCLTGDVLLVADRIDIVEGMLKRLKTKGGDSLADVKAFKYITERCNKDKATDKPTEVATEKPADKPTDKPAEKPQIRWFINPLAYTDAARAATPEDRRRRGKSIVEILETQGIGAVQGAGGFLSFAAEDYEMIHRTAVYAPKPWENAMKMLVLPAGKEFSPQKWVPRDIATYTTLYFDIPNAFDNFDTLFDELFGQGEKGVWKEVVRGLETDPSGPQIKLRDDLICHLGPRVTALSDYQLPITTKSERLFFAIETSNAKAVALAIEKLMKNDSSARRREIDGLTVWEIVPEEPEIPTLPVVALPGMGTPAPAAPQPQQEKLLPHAAITVVEGHLFCASHLDFLLKVLKTIKQPDPLDRDASYKLVDKAIAKLGFEVKSARTFSFTDEEYRATYELIRQNKMPESETMLARVINSIAGGNERGHARKSQLDGAKLPDYGVVRRYLGPAGMAIATETDGWFLKGFTLKKP